MFKPTQRSTLTDWLGSAFPSGSALPVETSRRSLSETPVVRHAPSAKVLVAEDVKVNRIVLEGFLRELGVAGTFVGDGIEVVVEFQRSGPYDVVLMDCQMPRRDGYEATRMIREIEAQRGLPRVPIVAVTAHALPDEARKISEAGMDAIVTKPIALDALRRAIRTAIGPTSTSEARPRAKNDVPSRRDDELSTRTFEELREVGAATPDLLVELVEAFASSANTYVTNISAAVVSGDVDSLRENAHSLKGSALTFGALAVADWAGTVERDSTRVHFDADRILFDGCGLIERAVRSARNWIARERDEARSVGVGSRRSGEARNDV